MFAGSAVGPSTASNTSTASTPPMHRFLRLVPLAVLAGCAQGCAIGKALYIAIVHNSGAPSRAERDVIDARESTMVADLQRVRVVVLPVAVVSRNSRFDTSAAASLAAGLRSHGVNATAAKTPVVLPYEPQPNELLTFWTRFKALGDSIRTNPVRDADYVLAVDVLGAPERRSIGAVHAMAVTADGQLAYHAAWNSKQPLYQQVKPTSVADANTMVITDLTRPRSK
jgi:hypothetical protein